MEVRSLKLKVELDTADLAKLAALASEIAKTAEALQRQSAEFAQACVDAYERPSCLEA